MAKTLNKSINPASPMPEQSCMPINPPDIDAMIAERAYYKAEQRGFAPGHELDDWLEAEWEVINIIR